MKYFSSDFEALVESTIFVKVLYIITVIDTQKFGCNNLIKIILDSDCYVVVLGWQGDRNHKKNYFKLKLNE